MFGGELSSPAAESLAELPVCKWLSSQDSGKDKLENIYTVEL